MRHLLSREHAGVLADLAAARTLIALDYDGTLAPIVTDRARAGMRARTATLLHAVARAYPTAVVTGRACADVEARLGGAPVRWLVGNHGLEPGEAGALRRFEDEAGQARVLLEQQLAGVRGVELEDKRYSLALHFRRAVDRAAARAAIDDAVAALPMPVRQVAGKAVLNVVPAAAPHKGAAVVRLRAAARATRVLYVGDDVTDEDVFALDAPWLVGVRIAGASLAGAPGAGATAARWCLHDQAEMDALLAALVTLRTGAAPGRPRESRAPARADDRRAARGRRRARGGAPPGGSSRSPRRRRRR